jgi:hypothetical protein
MQGKFLEEIEVCLSCNAFERNMDISGMKTTLKIIDQQFKEFSCAIKERDRDLEQISMELALGLSESFEALKKIATGDPTVRISEASEIKLRADA